MPEENNSQTPRTDAAEATRSCLECGVLRYVDADFCRELERTVNSTRDTNKRLRLENHAERAANARMLEEIEQLKHQRNRAALEERHKYLPQLEKWREVFASAKNIMAGVMVLNARHSYPALSIESFREMEQWLKTYDPENHGAKEALSRAGEE